MNMVTKSGSNELHGQAVIYYLTAASRPASSSPIYNGSPVKLRLAVRHDPRHYRQSRRADHQGQMVALRFLSPLRPAPANSLGHGPGGQSGRKDINHQTNTDLRSDYQVNSKNKFSFIWLYNEQNRFFRRDTAYSIRHCGSQLEAD